MSKQGETNHQISWGERDEVTGEREAVCLSRVRGQRGRSPVEQIRLKVQKRM